MKQLNDLGLIGLGNMGTNLSINIINNNFNLSIYNRTIDKINEFNKLNIKKNFVCFIDIKKFIFSIKKPRKIFIIITPGKSIDDLINLFINYLNEKDIIIDMSNSLYKDTIRRNKWIEKFNIFFLGIGVSGGLNGALNGISVMPSGDKNAFKKIKSILQKISYKKNNKICVNYLGTHGVGHYIKMIHNSIEYSNMQILSEIYFILKYIFFISNYDIALIMKNWNSTGLNSYLLNISYNIFLKKNNDDLFIDKISDETFNNGTTKWSIENALEIEEFSTLSAISLFIRYISTKKEDRVKIYKLFNKNFIKNKFNLNKNNLKNLKNCLYLCILTSYIQGISQIQKMSQLMKWNLNISNIIKTLNYGTIIESKILNKIYILSKKNKNFNYIDIIFFFKKNILNYLVSLRKISIFSIKQCIPSYVLNSTLMYYDIFFSKELSTKLVQAQRYYFGGHFYKKK